jgi:diguanylate cyclase (GGDEF)-like protein/PAS domain S-box-containing protein
MKYDITLESILDSQAITIPLSATVSEALVLIEQYSISSVVIVDDEKRPVGIFTEHDALRVVAESIATSSVLSDLMTPSPCCVPEKMQLHDAYTIMEEKGFRHLVVVDESGRFSGVVTEGDFLRHIGFEHLGKFKIVAEAMSNSPLIVEPKMSLVDAAGLMNERRCDYAVVLEGSHPVGIITERDIAHRCAHEEIVDETVGALLRDDIRLIDKDIPLHEAASIMEKHGIHQLIVVDEQGNLAGLLSRHDVLHAVHGAYFEFLIRVIDKKSAAIAKMGEKRDQLRTEKEVIERMAQKLLEQQKELERKDIALSTAQSLANIGSWRLDVSQNILEWSDETYRIFGVEIGTPLTYESFLSSVYPDDLLKVDRAWKAALEGAVYGIEHRIVVEGEVKWVKEHAKLEIDEFGFASGMGSVQVITERKNYEERLETLANYDPLTGLANRALLSSHLHSAIEKAKRHKTQIALMMFDLDRFKDVNDSFGHGAGDELLQHVAQRFESRLREGDIIGRLGGDEFAILLDHLAQPEDAGRIAETMTAALSVPYKLIGGEVVHIGMSVGIVLFPDHGENASELLQHADAALYKAKSEGRGMYRYYSDELTDLARRRIECETLLRRAVANNEFEVYYQPQVHIATGRIIGAEALVRWNDPDRGLILPGVFIPIAEDTGLIGAIGEWVLNETCRQGKIWLDGGHRLTLAVNLSAHQVRHQNIPELVEVALKRTGYPADKLELELTESALMQREEETVAMLHTLRALGIRLAIDDFGTGYSSLSYLKRFPIDVLKIDKSFVDDLPFDDDDMAIVTAIIAMGKALGFQILAEGTERIEQIEFLKERGCTMYQGYFKSPPLRAAEFEKLLL